MDMETESYDYKPPDSFPSRTPPFTKSSEYYAAEALAQDMGEHEVYIVGENTETVDEWLEKCAPSLLYKQDGVGWIVVIGPHEDDVEEPRVLELQDEWEKMMSSGRPINKENIFALAKAYGVTCGKWLIHVDSGCKGDYLWSLVAKAIVNSIISSSNAKISPTDSDDENYRHVICVYNKNFLDEDEVFRSEQDLRRIGIKCPMYYKPDIYTYLGIYRNNPWKLRPTIYVSNYDVINGNSTIEPC